MKPAPLLRRKTPVYLAAALVCLLPRTVTAHPHVFVDGGIDFVVSEQGTLDTLQVTWVYDAFETLYILSTYDLVLNTEGTLDEQDRLALVAYRSDWPDDFDGSAHVTVDGELAALEWPRDLDADVVDGRLVVTFMRDLSNPIDLSKDEVSVAFYESTYFFSFRITQEPRFLGGSAYCEAEIIPYDPTDQSTALKELLAQLSREDTPTIKNVGANFADRINLICGED